MEVERQSRLAERRPEPAQPVLEPIDQRLCVEVDSPDLGYRKSGVRAKSCFKPRHLTSAFGRDNQTMYALPGGPLGVEMQDSSMQPPVEQNVLDAELRHVRDNVLTAKVAQQRAARNNSGNDDQFFG